MSQYSLPARQKGPVAKGEASEGLLRLLQEMQGLCDLMPGVADCPQVGPCAASGRHDA